MYKTIPFDVYKHYEDWLIEIQNETMIEVVSVTEFKNSLIVTYKEY